MVGGILPVPGFEYRVSASVSINFIVNVGQFSILLNLKSLANLLDMLVAQLEFGISSILPLRFYLLPETVDANCIHQYLDSGFVQVIAPTI